MTNGRRMDDSSVLNKDGSCCQPLVRELLQDCGCRLPFLLRLKQHWACARVLVALTG